MRLDHPHRLPREFTADRWILESDARSAIVYASPTLADATLVGSTIRVDGCDYCCVAIERGPGGRAAGVRLRLFVESL
jgi:hypothetical protein